MSYFYLISSLPHLEMERPPLSEEEFLAQCEAQMSDRDLQHLTQLLVHPLPPVAATHPFSRAWRNHEVQLRNAIVRMRGTRKHTDPGRYLRTHEGFLAWMEADLESILNQKAPLERERALDQVRWSVLDDLQGVDPFSFRIVLAYALKRRIAERWTRMDAEAGWQQARQTIEQQPARDHGSRDEEPEIAAASGA